MARIGFWDNIIVIVKLYKLKPSQKIITTIASYLLVGPRTRDVFQVGRAHSVSELTATSKHNGNRQPALEGHATVW